MFIFISVYLIVTYEGINNCVQTDELSVLIEWLIPTYKIKTTTLFFGIKTFRIVKLLT